MIRSCASGFRQEFRSLGRRRSPIVTRELVQSHERHCSSVPSNQQSDDLNKNAYTVVYERDSTRNALPKAAFLFSSLNSTYWLWYVFDFIPALNASPIEDLHVDPIYGFGGLGLSLLIQSVFTFYPMSLVSKIGVADQKNTPPAISKTGKSDGQINANSNLQRDVLIWKHTLPFLRPSHKPMTIPVGGITMDKTSDDTRKILVDLGGDIGKFEGHLGLVRSNLVTEKNRNSGSSTTSKSTSLTIQLPLLVDIRSPSEVPDSEMMLQTLLSGKFKQANRNEGVDSVSGKAHTQQHRKRRRKNRGAKR